MLHILCTRRFFFVLIYFDSGQPGWTSRAECGGREGGGGRAKHFAYALSLYQTTIFLHWTKFKAFEDDKIKISEIIKFFL